MSTFEMNSTFSGNDTSEEYIESNVGDFTPFYVAIAISSALLGIILLLNTVCCCSRFAAYWLDKRTGNRWLVTVWTETPHQQSPLDLSELKEVKVFQFKGVIPYNQEFIDKDTKIATDTVLPTISQQLLTASEEYYDLNRRESNI